MNEKERNRYWKIKQLQEDYHYEDEWFFISKFNITNEEYNTAKKLTWKELL